MHAYGWSGDGSQGISHADGPGLNHVPFGLVNGEPCHLSRFAGRADLAIDDTAPERERDDAAGHVRGV